MLDIALFVGEAALPEQLKCGVPVPRCGPHTGGHLPVETGQTTACQVVDQVAGAQLNVPVDVAHVLSSLAFWKSPLGLPPMPLAGLAPAALLPALPTTR